MTEETAPTTETSVDKVTESLTIPITFDEMVRMASSAMADAYEQGIKRQMMRVLLPRDPSNEQIGVFFENDADVDTQNLVLFPIDESWQGGIMQLYRAAQPTVESILRYAPEERNFTFHKELLLTFSLVFYQTVFSKRQWCSTSYPGRSFSGRVGCGWN